MAYFFTAVGFLCFQVCLILTIINAIKKRPLKKWLIRTGALFVLFGITTTFIPDKTLSSEQEEQTPYADVQEDNMDETTSTETVEATEIETKTDPEVDAGAKKGTSIDACVLAMKLICHSSFDNNYEITVDDENSCINVKVWEDGVAFAMIAAMAGEEEEISAWNDILELIIPFQKELQSVCYDLGYDNYQVAVSVVSDKDPKHEGIFITAKNGEIVYDILNKEQ